MDQYDKAVQIDVVVSKLVFKSNRTCNLYLCSNGSLPLANSYYYYVSHQIESRYLACRIFCTRIKGEKVLASPATASRLSSSTKQSLFSFSLSHFSSQIKTEIDSRAV